MEDQSKKRLLYFDDDEIITGKTENKKVFVTKRINGKEVHTKQKKEITEEIPRETEYKRVPNTQGFNFEREIVIGVNNKKQLPNNKSFNKPKKSCKDNEKKAIINEKNKKSTKKSRLKECYYDDAEKSNIQKKHDNKKKKKKAYKKNKRKKVIIAMLSITTMIIALAIMALLTPTFNIQEIKVEGNNKVTTSNIINLSRLKLGQNIFKNNKKSIEQYIKENTYIEKVEVTRKIPSTILLRVEERKAAYQVKLISSYVYIDKNGYILESGEKQENIISLEGLATPEEVLLNGKQLEQIDLKKLSKIVKLEEILVDLEGINLSDVKINIKNENNFIIFLNNENKKIYIGDLSDLSNKMLYIKKILENEKGHSGIIFINGNLNEGFLPYFREEEYSQ